MAITTGRRPRLSKPRQAAILVESAALVSAAVLMGWLALWLVQQRAQGLAIHAQHLPNADLAAVDAPFPAADARSILGSAPVEASPSGFMKGVEGVVNSPGGPVVVYLAAPLLGYGPDQPIGDTTIAGLIEKIAATTRRDVVLAIDLAQVDSDRDLGVYAASPYHGLADAVAKIKPGDHAVYVLTSAAPAQKSWVSDALGGSVFGHFLRAGLKQEGGAGDWDGEAVAGRVGVDGLHRYVRDHVARWAEKYRGAVQTPMLLRVGDEPRRPVMLALAKTPPAPAQVTVPEAPAPEKPKAEADAAAKDPAAKPAPAPVGPRIALLNDLVAEWKEHDALAAEVPWRTAPARFRGYQAGLLLAERRLRSAWNAPEALAEARAELTATTSHRHDVRAAMKAAASAAAEFPFRAVRRDEAGRRELTAALVYLTGTGPDPDLFAAPAPAPNPQPAGAEKPTVPAPKGPAEAPSALVEAKATGYPERYLELQVAAWALQYVEAFRVPSHFRDDRRGMLLRRLVDARSWAEDALETDHRGLDWLRQAVAKGDEERRRLQDRLFAPAESTGDAGKAMAEQIAALPRLHYDPARRRATVFHDGRVAWERTASRLADLAEWAVRARPPASGADPLPAAAVAALDDAEALVRELDRDPGEESEEEKGRRADAIVEASRKSEASIDALERDMLASIRSDVAWKSRDAALRTPWIPADARKVLLEAVTRAPEAMATSPAPPSTPAASEADEVDPGFWALAGGLARLDERLRRIARPASAPDSDGDHVAAAWEAVRSREDAGRALESFRAYGEAARKQRDADRAGRPRDEARKPEALHAILRDQDRAVRLVGRPEAKSDPAADGRVSEWDALGRFRTLAFHLARLRDDDVPASPTLAAMQAGVARQLKIVPGPDPFVGWAPLAVRIEPAGIASVQIRKEDGLAEIRVGLKHEEDRESRIPRGLAFVGLAAPTVPTPPAPAAGPAPPAPAPLVIRGAKSGAASPPGVLKEVGGGFDSTLDDYTIRQVDASANAEPYSLAAIAFYRGRVDAPGIVALSVIPQSFSRLVQVRMTYDPDDIRRRFGDLADRIRDQFELHPGFGYMHKGKSASYRLVFENLTFQPLKVHLRRTLQAGPDKPGSPIDAQEVVLDLPARKSGQVSGVVTSAQVPFGEVRTLRVEYGVDGRPGPASTYDVEFAQVGLKDYMDATPLIRVENDYADRVPRDSYVVDFRRRADDKVREPILGDEIVVTVNGEEQPGITIWPGDAGFHAYSPRTTNARKFTWSARFGNDAFEAREAAP